MANKKSEVWKNRKTQQLAEVLSSIADIPTMQKFLRDVMTEKEIVEISARLEAAKMLESGNKYTDIVYETKLSSRTVARISDWLQNGSGGYAVVLKSVKNHHDHTSPVRAE